MAAEAGHAGSIATIGAARAAITGRRERLAGLVAGRGALAAAMLAPAGDHLAEAAEAEDQHQGGEAERRGQHRGGDLLADREGGHVGAAREDRQQQRLLDAGAAGGEREHRGDHLHGEHEQRVAHRAADVEGVQQRPVGEEARHPAGQLPGWPSRGGSGGGRRGSSGRGGSAARRRAPAPRAARSRPGTRSPAPSGRTA